MPRHKKVQPVTNDRPPSETVTVYFLHAPVGELAILHRCLGVILEQRSLTEAIATRAGRRPSPTPLTIHDAGEGAAAEVMEPVYLIDTAKTPPPPTFPVAPVRRRRRRRMGMPPVTVVSGEASGEVEGLQDGDPGLPPESIGDEQ